MIAFIQVYGLNGPAGGPKLLRGLLQADHPPVLSIYTGAEKPPLSPAGIEEMHLPKRPDLGRIDHSRFHAKVGVFDRIYRSRFERRLRSILLEHDVKYVHVIPYDYDIVPTHRVALELKIPCFVTVHDDIESTIDGHPFKNEVVAATAEIWRNAKAAFAISEEIGREYCRRYGARKYEIVTDGLTTVAEAPKRWDGRTLRIYFMGLFHPCYRANFRSLLDALQIVRSERPEWSISLTSRSGYIQCSLHPDDVPVEIVRFSTDVREAERDMLASDLLYLPMTFEIANFGKFSMSTKMVSYLGSGIPILYHGPEIAAACKLLAGHNAAICSTSLNPQAMARQLIDAMAGGEGIAGKALALARSQYMLADQQRRFWRPIVEAMQ